jgi:rubrerythrin
MAGRVSEERVRRGKDMKKGGYEEKMGHRRNDKEYKVSLNKVKSRHSREYRKTKEETEQWSSAVLYCTVCNVRFEASVRASSALSKQH